MVFHWLGTQLLAPVLMLVVGGIFSFNPVLDSIEFLVLAILFSSFLSMPTFLVYFLAYHYFAARNVQWKSIKWILIGITVSGAIITNFIISGSYMPIFAIYYGASAAIGGILLGRRY
ncbi:MAG: hypothetical protein HWD92_07050 [Flavobacteriia bacterium]|nr:hypothetical protein [Flavobacteriia bacterium]